MQSFTSTWTADKYLKKGLVFSFILSTFSQIFLELFTMFIINDKMKYYTIIYYNIVGACGVREKCKID